MLREETLFGEVDKVQIAIERLRAFEPKTEPYWGAFSGGKDSQCIYHLAQMAGVNVEWHYSVTGVDPPEVMRFIKKNYPDVKWDRHEEENGGKPLTMWGLIAQHTIPPTRQARYCCSALKESGGAGRLVITGVRWAESARRKELHGIADIQTRSKKLHQEAFETNSTATKVNKNGGLVFMDDNVESRRMVEQCYLKRKTTINPIVDWTDEDVWEFLNDVAAVEHCCLYDPPFNLKRIGCIGCPLQGRDGMLADFEIWPRYKELYIRAFDKMIANHPGEIRVATGEMAISGGGGYSSENGSTGAHEPSEPGDKSLVQDEGRGGSLSGVDSSMTLSERERERERETRTAHGRVGGTPNLRPLDMEPQTGNGARNQASAPARPERKKNKHVLPEQWWLTLTAEENFAYWISNC